jgi:CRISPR/Cas system CMR-associated protein Cmr1 (group 7 of RAMP superfamily)
MEYLLIKEASLELFNEKINSSLKNKWQLHGETFIYKLDECIYYTQVIIKKGEIKKGNPVVDDSIGQIIASWNC